MCVTPRRHIFSSVRPCRHEVYKMHQSELLGAKGGCIYIYREADLKTWVSCCSHQGGLHVQVGMIRSRYWTSKMQGTQASYIARS